MQVARGIDLYMNKDKTVFMYFKRERAIPILSRNSLKLVDYYKYLGSNISSSESDVNIKIEKV